MFKDPLVYHPRYKIGASWLKHLHKLDIDKPGDLFNALVHKGLISAERIHRPNKATTAQMHAAHTPDFMNNKLTSKQWLSDVFQVEAIGKTPLALTKYFLLTPIFYHAGGTILASELAADKGWAINLGGGAHHSHAEDASGFCIVADISMSIHHIRKIRPAIKNIMIIDLDAHQGNGHERDFLYDPHVYTVDMFTYGLSENGQMFYPDDQIAMQGINIPVKLNFGTQDDEYLHKLECALTKAQTEFAPDMIYYVAGTDILQGDSLGKQNISKKGLIMRDEMVFRFARTMSAPIVTVQAGGYQPGLGNIIADSIENLDNKFDLLG